ncbi:probable aspartyl protease At4g16563 [Mangifera indica]|uniref:probable aspartyl protease At4g16563 n=1 Tax=Mangifera indica TaxID=29780 RepID=UPI001CFA5D0B|nr:probable aspartyl protease At4g16563 [Mangifera indica]
MTNFMALSHLLSLLFLLTTATTAAATTITIPLTPLEIKHASSDSYGYKLLNSLASSSLSRAQHLKSKSPIKIKTNSSSLSTPLSSHSYGGYSISLSFGTPPQLVTLIFDTGSSLVWFPCTAHYLCLGCYFPNVDPADISTFIPKNSSTSKLIGCKNPKCAWIFGSEIACSQTCPYMIQYGLGSTAGILLSETLDFPNKKFPDFLSGCSVVSTRQPAGIAGFGRGKESLPSQLGVGKFSYCLLSRKFDDTSVSSNLVLDIGSDSGNSTTSHVSYTTFLKNPTGADPAFRQYYYVLLRKIVVGTRRIKIPYRFSSPGSDGKGGTIVDSGSTFTFMEKPVFDAVAEEFIKQVGNDSRAPKEEIESGLRPCFKISGDKSVNIPKLTFRFKGGSKMALPLENYFVFYGNKSAICLTIVTENSVEPGISSTGPAIILGSFQVQNFYLEFNLAQEKFGFARKNCSGRQK